MAKTETKQNTLNSLDIAIHEVIGAFQIMSGETDKSKASSEEKKSQAQRIVDIVIEQRVHNGVDPEDFFTHLYDTEGYSYRIEGVQNGRPCRIDVDGEKAPASVSQYKTKIVGAYNNNGKSFDGVSTMADVTRLYDNKSAKELLRDEKLKTLGKLARKANPEIINDFLASFIEQLEKIQPKSK